MSRVGSPAFSTFAMAVACIIVFGSLAVVGEASLTSRGDAMASKSLARSAKKDANSAHEDANAARTQVLAVTSEDDSRFKALQASVASMGAEIATVQAMLSSAQRGGGLTPSQVQGLQAELATLRQEFAAVQSQLAARPAPSASPSALGPGQSAPPRPAPSPSCLLGHPLAGSPLPLPSPLGCL